MTSVISELTPQMGGYSEHFIGSVNLDWVPYVMYFHPRNYANDVVSTDEHGFRFTDARGRRYGLASGGEDVRLLVGSSTVFGVGVTADSRTLAARLTERDDRPEYWVNFGGRAFNATQELVSFVLNQHLLSRVREIVIFSGFNDLALSKLPARLRGAHGGFFFGGHFADRLNLKPRTFLDRVLLRDGQLTPDGGEDVLPPDRQIEFAAATVLRRLKVWWSLAMAVEARLTFVLQPLADWVRPEGPAEEQRIFAELDTSASFGASYEHMRRPQTHAAYSERLRAGIAEIPGVDFLDMTSLLAEVIDPETWIFTDRIHFTDAGTEIVAGILLDRLRRNI